MDHIRNIPSQKGVDHSLPLLKEGYTYISTHSQRLNSPLFTIRLLGKEVICMTGKDAAELFYEPDKFTRSGVAPNRILQTLLGKNSVQTLDGETHKHRKAMLMEAMTPSHIERLISITQAEWGAAIEGWEKKESIMLYEEVQELLCRAACAWTGLPIQQDSIKQLTKDLAAMVESASAIGPSHWLARHARNRTEKWINAFIKTVRHGNVTLSETSILHPLVWFKDADGELLDTEVVAVEVINLIRPLVVISVYIAFIALALHQYPDEKDKVKEGNSSDADKFIDEVRRFYPFFPFQMAQVKKDFHWQGYPFEKDTYALLDIYGTNHDPAVWEQPEVFHPDRFNTAIKPFSFIPQGGGDVFVGHRCAGQQATIELMKVSLEALTNRMEYEVPTQDVTYDMSSIPSIPKSKIFLKNITKKSHMY